MSKLYALQILLIFGFVGVVGMLPTISDGLSQMLPQPAYAQTFHPVALAQSTDDLNIGHEDEMVARIPESMTQTASLDLQEE